MMPPITNHTGSSMSFLSGFGDGRFAPAREIPGGV